MTAEAAARSAVDATRDDPSAAGTDEPAARDAILHMLALPEIHCGACIAGVERRLATTPGVRSARVNLTLKRAAVETDPGVAADDLVRSLAERGYLARELDALTLPAAGIDGTGRDLLMRLGVAGFAAMNVMLLSVAVWSGAADSTRDLFHWISALIAIPALAYSARPFFRNAWSALSALRLDMDVPISLAILLAIGISVYETSLSGEHAYFDAALALAFFLLAGRYLDHRARAAARSAAGEISALEAPRACRVRAGIETEIRVAEIEAGDLLRVLPGGRVPADGEIVEGETELDRSFLTGESMPAFAGSGAPARAGEVNLTGPFLMRATAKGEDSALRRLAELVAVTETARNRYASLADRAARIYAPAIHALALGAFLAWIWMSGDMRLSLNVAAATLIIACPCALGLAVPTATAVASGRLFRKGLLIKSPTALERLAEIDATVFDKTGTLTEGRPRLADAERHDPDDLALASALARGSSHPLAAALAERAEANAAHIRLAELREIPGRGIEAEWKGQTARLGRADWVGTDPVPGTAAYLRRGDRVVVFRFVDRLREGAAEAVAALEALGQDVFMLSGDHSAAAADVAARAGIGNFEADALPEEKARRVREMAESGRKILMVGDGLNDTAALAAAHASISPASALDAARAVSDVVLLGRSLEPVADAVAVARAATRRIRENFAIAACYNAVAIPVALAGFATPLAAALAMSASSICVSLNALRLR